jgi:hypothetical protein
MVTRPLDEINPENITTQIRESLLHLYSHNYAPVSC